jgi:hypothetical protein
MMGVLRRASRQQKEFVNMAMNAVARYTVEDRAKSRAGLFLGS